MEEYEIYLKRCIDLATNALGNTYPNPMVGAVIVHNGCIIGEGWHKKAGDHHAEINAILSVNDKELLKKSTLYVSLEPCSHFGKTPPCCFKIIEMGIPKVVIGTTDPNPLVHGKGIKLLQNAGIEVVTNVLDNESEELNKRFNCFHQKKRPYIFLKWAETADGFVDKTEHTDGIFWISNRLSKLWVHQLRATEQAILVGKNTVLKDQPSLTTREVIGTNPIRLIIDPQAEIRNLELAIFDDSAETFVFNFVKEQQIRDNIWVQLNPKQELIAQILEFLYKKNIQSLIVEGGSNTLRYFIDQNYWDEAFVINAPQVFAKHGTKAPKLPKKKYKSLDLEDNSIHFYKNESRGV